MITFIEKKHVNWLINGLVLLFFITLLSLPKGYSYMPITLASISIIYLGIYLFKSKNKFVLSKEDKLFIYTFICYFLTFCITTLIHQDSLREIDNPSRVLLFLPLLLLFTHFPIQLNILLIGIPIGAAIAGFSALYQRFYLGWYGAFLKTMSIQSGDIAISLAMMSLAISIYWCIKKEYKYVVFSVISSFLGIAASGLSGARGGWIGIPIILAIILYFAYKQLSKKWVIALSSLTCILILAMAFSPQTHILNRITLAHNDITAYIEHNNKNTSVGARLDMWQSGLLGIKEKPLLGWGQNQYMALKKQQVEQGIIAPSTYIFTHAHNQYIDTLVKRGLLGFLGLVGALLIPLFYFIKQFRQSEIKVKTVGLLGIIHIISVLFFNMTQSFFAHNSGTIFYFFLVILLYKVAEHLKK